MTPRVVQNQYGYIITVPYMRVINILATMDGIRINVPSVVSRAGPGPGLYYRSLSVILSRNHSDTPAVK